MQNAVRFGALLASVLLFALFVTLILRDADAGQYVTVAVLLVFFVMATRLDDLTNLSVSATGLQAALEKKLSEAQATVKQLQRIAEVFGHSSVLQISSSNRLGGLSSKIKRDHIASIERELRAIQVDEDQIAAILSPQRTFDRLDYFLWLSRGVPANATPQQAAASISFQLEFPITSYHSLPVLTDVEAYMIKHDLMHGEKAEIFADWKQYENSFTHRRVEQWDNRDA